MTPTVTRLTPDDPDWPLVVQHLRRVNMGRWVLDKDQRLLPDLVLLGVMQRDRIVGHLCFMVQDMVCPATEWSDNEETPILGPDGATLQETYVYTFAVEEKHRRKGLGRALQLAALDWTRRLGCYQMRSWSSADKTANYALKISLGFAIHPATQETAKGYPVSGVYFVQIVGPDTSC